MTLVFSTLVFSGVESTSALAADADKITAKTDNLPADSKIFAPQKPESTKELKASELDIKKNPSVFKKEADSKPKKKFARFFIAMLCVLFSSLAIFGGLKLYKYLASKKGLSSKNSTNKQSLESPKTFKETINLFLDKTDK
jgi:hypothetical protein